MTTAFALVTDRAYFNKAEQSIAGLRYPGGWTGDIVLVCVDFLPSDNFKDYYKVTCHQVPHIDVSRLREAWAANPIRRAADDRHTKKLAQWNKLYLFDTWITKWERIIYIDAGMRVFKNIAPLLALDWRGSIVAPDDSLPGDNGNRLGCQFDLSSNLPVTNMLFEQFGSGIISRRYFLNCIWIFDTSIVHHVNTRVLAETMNKYPISMTNEMAIMNLLLYEYWKPMPEKDGDDYIFGWSELNYTGLTWRNFCMIKYPVTC